MRVGPFLLAPEPATIGPETFALWQTMLYGEGRAIVEGLRAPDVLSRWLALRLLRGSPSASGRDRIEVLWPDLQAAALAAADEVGALWTFELDAIADLSDAPPPDLSLSAGDALERQTLRLRTWLSRCHDARTLEGILSFRSQRVRLAAAEASPALGPGAMDRLAGGGREVLGALLARPEKEVRHGVLSRLARRWIDHEPGDVRVDLWTQLHEAAPQGLGREARQRLYEAACDLDSASATEILARDPDLPGEWIGALPLNPTAASELYTHPNASDGDRRTLLDGRYGRSVIVDCLTEQRAPDGIVTPERVGRAAGTHPYDLDRLILGWRHGTEALWRAAIRRVERARHRHDGLEAAGRNPVLVRSALWDDLLTYGHDFLLPALEHARPDRFVEGWVRLDVEDQAKWVHEFNLPPDLPDSFISRLLSHPDEAVRQVAFAARTDSAGDVPSPT